MIERQLKNYFQQLRQNNYNSLIPEFRNSIKLIVSIPFKSCFETTFLAITIFLPFALIFNKLPISLSVLFSFNSSHT
jgi:hypothetical protein